MDKSPIAIAVKILKANGYKITRQRQSLLELLAQSGDRYLELTELDRLMRLQFPKMSHNTIYRNVKEFAALGIVEENQNENDGKTEVKLDCNEQHAHHHHFICNQCGKVQELKMCPLSFLVTSYRVLRLPDTILSYMGSVQSVQKSSRIVWIS